MFEKLAIGAVAVAIFVGFRRFVTSSESAITQDFGERLAESAASWISGAAGMSIEQTLAALRDLKTRKVAPDLLRLKRIDYELAKRGPNDVALNLTIIWDAGDGNLKVGRIEESLAWTDVPSEARAAFIRGEPSVAYAWYDSTPVG